MQLCRHLSSLSSHRQFASRISIKKKLLRCQSLSNFIQRTYVVSVRDSRDLTASVRLQTLLPRIVSKERLPEQWDKALRCTTPRIEKSLRRVAVYGLDRLADPHSLITALLDDPFVSLETEAMALRNRPINIHAPMIISSSNLIKFTDSSTSTSSPECDNISYLQLKLPRLTHLNAELLELPSEYPNPLPLLWSADVRLLVATPAVFPVSHEFLSLISQPSTLFILQYPSDDRSIIEHSLTSLTDKRPELMSNVTVYLVYPRKALSASDTFRLGPPTRNSVDAFQRGHIESGILPVVQKVHSLLSASDDILERKRSSSIVTGAIEACRESIHTSRRDFTTVQSLVTNLRRQVEFIRQSNELDATHDPYQLDMPASIRRSTQKMTCVLQSISWWKLPFMVDDLSDILNNSIRHNWCPDVVTSLEFRAGKLSLLRQQLISQTMATCSQLPRSFQSSVVKNTLEQESSNLNAIEPNVLSQPISHRTKQLGESVTRLHRQVQNALLTFFGGVLGSSGAAYAAWFWQYLPGYDALGWGALGTIVTLRFLVRSWQKIQKKWWNDWNRAGKGLERDINTILKTTMEERVLVVPIKAIEMLEAAIQHRTEHLDTIEKELDDIKAGTPMFPQSNTT